MYPSSSPYSVYLIALVVVGEVAVSTSPDEVGGLNGAAQVYSSSSQSSVYLIALWVVGKVSVSTFPGDEGALGTVAEEAGEVENIIDADVETGEAVASVRKPKVFVNPHMSSRGACTPSMLRTVTCGPEAATVVDEGAAIVVATAVVVLTPNQGRHRGGRRG